MHGLLNKWFKKLNISGYQDLSGEEKETFDRWNAILSTEGDMTLEKLDQFVESQRKIIEEKWSVTDRDRTNDSHLADIYNVYGQIQKAINSSQAERENLEKYLTNLIDSG